MQNILRVEKVEKYYELYRGSNSRKEFFNRIIEIVTVLGGD